MENEIHNLINLDEIKQCLRITTDIDDKIIKDLLEAALFQLEKYIGKTLIQKTYEQSAFDYDDSKVNLLHRPVSKVISVESDDGKEIKYYLEKNSVILLENVKKPIKIKYVSGVFKNSLPSVFKIAIMEIISYLYNADLSQNSLDTILKNFHFLKEFRL